MMNFLKKFIFFWNLIKKDNYNRLKLIKNKYKSKKISLIKARQKINIFHTFSVNNVF